jgi:large subunit ribosomal protein L4
MRSHDMSLKLYELVGTDPSRPFSPFCWRTRMALAQKIQNEELVVIDDLALSEPRTKDMAVILKALNLRGLSTLVATAGYDVNVLKSARNIDKVTVSSVGELNALAILQPRRVLMTKAALDAVRERSRSKSAAVSV